MTNAKTSVDAGSQAEFAALFRLVDVVTPYAIRVAATLRLADLIAEGVHDVGELAARCEANPDALGRLLRYLSCRGVFTADGPGRFGMSPLAEYLRENHWTSIRQWLDLNGASQAWDRSFPWLLESVRSGAPAHARVFGDEFWSSLDSDPALAESFTTLMELQAAQFAPDIVTGYEWSGVEYVVDVGAGRGVLLANLLRGHSHLRGTLVDVPAVIAQARVAMAERGLAVRCTFEEASFFDPLPKDGQVYLLSNVLHDWADGDAVRILRRCAEAAGPDGRVLIIEQAAGGRNDFPFTDMDLRMLILFGGRERTWEQHAVLAAEAGLHALPATVTPSGRTIIELVAAGR